jgi:hypothetical protein
LRTLLHSHDGHGICLATASAFVRSEQLTKSSPPNFCPSLDRPCSSYSTVRPAYEHRFDRNHSSQLLSFSRSDAKSPLAVIKHTKRGLDRGRANEHRYIPRDANISMGNQVSEIGTSEGGDGKDNGLELVLFGRGGASENPLAVRRPFALTLRACCRERR